MKDKCLTGGSRKDQHWLKTYNNQRRRRIRRVVEQLESEFKGLEFDRWPTSAGRKFRIARFGQLPVEATGTFNGEPFYFRYRHDHASLQVGTFYSSHCDLTGEPYAGDVDDLEQYGLLRLFRELIRDLKLVDPELNQLILDWDAFLGDQVDLDAVEWPEAAE